MRLPGALLPILAVTLFAGCSKTSVPDTNNNNNNNVSTNVPPHTPRWLISSVYSGDGYFSSTTLTYDSADRLVSFTGVPGDYLVFYKNDTIHHILQPPSSANSLFSRSSWIFQYRSDKKCYRVLYKHIDSYNAADVADANPFWSDETNASAYTLDSLVYSMTGQLTEIWEPGNVVYKFVYDSANAVVPSKINDYIDNDGDGIPEYIKYGTSLFYSNIDQPASTQLWFFPFVFFNIPVSPNSPATYSGKFGVFLKKAIQQYDFHDDGGYFYLSPNFTYSYDADSTHFSGVCSPQDLSAWFGYKFIKQ